MWTFVDPRRSVCEWLGTSWRATRPKGAPRAATYNLTDKQKEAGHDDILTQETHHGYLFWGLTTAAVLVTELLGANFLTWLTKFLHLKRVHITIPWPTISWTVGRLENEWSPTAAFVVALIAVSVFYALSKQPHRTSQGRYLRGTGERTPVRFYGWPMSIVPPVIAGLIGYYAIGVNAKHLEGDESAHRKFLLGCVIYGTFAALGVIIPSLLIVVFRREVQFPTLMFTIRRLRHALPWTAALIVGGMAILIIHLALYPWPDITKEPVKYAGNTADSARAKAVTQLKEVRDPALTKLIASAQIRGIDGGDEAWVVFFKPRTTAGLVYGGCFVTVKGDTTPVATKECTK